MIFKILFFRFEANSTLFNLLLRKLLSRNDTWII